ncbi:hypothetical protein THAOC_33651 [Thalassiosira oceanica]|uniref:Uncharacterized protein n=1 Tax=Thalassiosira oceanica TaxID=159749 RepID=K0RF07_THAOC|nr:hypothetical protein THAOC_33651 [Thalassiosira oceanica]|eukprot:EJK47616.1 hypothetical protein THAOC_33651 [Thalassiosira oceanica]
MTSGRGTTSSVRSSASAPSVMVGAEVRTGDLLKFRVRDQDAAPRSGKWRARSAGARTRRKFSPSPRQAARRPAELGRSLFGRQNIDVGSVGGPLPGGVGDDDGEGSRPAFGCFYANGEIGPTGVAGGSRETHIHGFATVACVMSDFGSPSSSSPSPQGPEANADKSGFEDDSAWG